MCVEYKATDACPFCTASADTTTYIQSGTGYDVAVNRMQELTTRDDSHRTVIDDEEEDTSLIINFSNGVREERERLWRVEERVRERAQERLRVAISDFI